MDGNGEFHLFFISHDLESSNWNKHFNSLLFQVWGGCFSGGFLVVISRANDFGFGWGSSQVFYENCHISA